MAARARTRPRPARPERSPRARKRKSQFSLSSLNRPEVLGSIAALAAVVALLFLTDVRAAIADGRDWVLRSFGLGIFVILAWVVLATAAAWKEWYLDGGRFWRRAGGVAALGLFIW